MKRFLMMSKILLAAALLLVAGWSSLNRQVKMGGEH
mgnify:CR=1 FL=1